MHGFRGYQSRIQREQPKSTSAFKKKSSGDVAVFLNDNDTGGISFLLFFGENTKLQAYMRSRLSAARIK